MDYALTFFLNTNYALFCLIDNCCVVITLQAWDSVVVKALRY